MLELAGVDGGWGRTVVVEDANLSIGAGECLAIIGRNGVGKTTLLELVAGRARQTAGRILLANGELSGLSIYARNRAGLGYVPQNREVFPSLTVREHLRVASRPGRWTVASVLDLLPRLGQRFNHLARHLSGGEQQMLAIARALVGNPRLLLMDEPSEGLAPVVVEQLVAVLKTIIADGELAMLLVEQHIEIALDLSNRFIVMDRGRIAHQGSSGAYRERTNELAPLMGLGA